MNKTLKSKVLDFVETKKSATWKEIHDFMLIEKGFPTTKEYRGWYASYFSANNWRRSGLLMTPTRTDNRFLHKVQSVYVVIRKIN